MMINIRFLYLFIICGVFLLLFGGCYKFRDEKTQVVYVNIDELMTLHPNYKFLSEGIYANASDILPKSTDTPVDFKTSLVYDFVAPFSALQEYETAVYTDTAYLTAQLNLLRKYHAQELKDLERDLRIYMYDDMSEEVAHGAQNIIQRRDFDREAYFNLVAQKVSIARTEVSSADYRRKNKIESTQNQLTSEANARAFLAEYNETLEKYNTVARLSIEELEKSTLNKYIGKISSEVKSEEKNSLALLKKRSEELQNAPVREKIAKALPAFIFSGIQPGQLYVLPINRDFIDIGANIDTKIDQNYKKDYNIIKKETYALANLYAKRYNYIISEKSGKKDITKDIEKWIKTVWSY